MIKLIKMNVKKNVNKSNETYIIDICLTIETLHIELIVSILQLLCLVG